MVLNDRGVKYSSFSWYNLFMAIKVKDFQNNKIYLSQYGLDDIKNGDIIVAAQNTAQLQWGGTTKTIWGDGSWTQYGPMARTTSKHALCIQVPNNERWTIKIHHITGTCKIPNGSWSHSGIAEIDWSLSGTKRYLTSCLVANGDLFIHQESEVIRVLEPGDIKYYVVWVRTNSTGQGIWYGGGPTTATDGGFSFGISCLLEATMVNREIIYNPY